MLDIFRRALLANAKQNVLLADSTKFGKRGFLKLFEWSNVDILITDDEIAEDAVTSLQENAPHLKVEIAKRIGRPLPSIDAD